MGVSLGRAVWARAWDAFGVRVVRCGGSPTTAFWTNGDRGILERARGARGEITPASGEMGV
jgi:hypothetical protein